MRQIREIVIHCTASPDYMDIGAKEINDWHKDRGWSGIGYHYVVRRNGEVEKGRDDNKPGAHVRGHNRDTIGVVWVGTDQIGPEQEKGLIGLVNYLRGKYNIPIESVRGHKEYPNVQKTCPNLDMDRLRAELIFVQPKPKFR